MIRLLTALMRVLRPLQDRMVNILICTNLVMLLWVGIVTAQRDRARADRVKAEIAQEYAETAQTVIYEEVGRQSAAIARKNDEQAKAIYEAGRRAGAAYADAHRVRGNACPASQAHLSAATRPAQVDNSAAGWVPDDMVAVSRADFDACTAAGTRLIAVHQAWEDLKAAGLAVAEEGQ